MVTCKTICVNCAHHNGASSKDVWYDHYCLSSAGVRSKEQNPVTGEIGYCGKDSLGGIYFTEDAHPFCRNINYGNCEHFDRRK